MREESDSLGILQIDDNALYGIHSVRAAKNFPLATSENPFSVHWFRAMGQIKQAYFITSFELLQSCKAEGIEPSRWKIPSQDQLHVLQKSAAEISAGKHLDSFIVPAIQGGAGTSINMNINEILANVSLRAMGHNPGEYHIIHPIETCNVFQSTNDVVPSALKIALMDLFQRLEIKISATRLMMEHLETRHRSALRFSYTQMQAAVPSTWGRFFSIFSEAFSRDWWRISKCQERLKALNLGGGASGTGLTTPRYIIMKVTDTLRNLTNLPICRAENLTEANANQDLIAEAHSLAKIHALNLEKMTSDLRLLGSDIAGNILKLPAVQTGSSVMPGKINPVIPEFVTAISSKIQSNDSLIAHLCASGTLDLNQNLPMIGHAALESLQLLLGVHDSLTTRLLHNLGVVELDYNELLQTPICTTALIPIVGYEMAEKMARKMQQENLSILQVAEMAGLSPAEIQDQLSPEKLIREGFSLKSTHDIGSKQPSQESKGTQERANGDSHQR
jgi:aspartate ammonia-lyase